MIFQQFRHEHGGCLSYVVGCTQKQVCFLVDPQFDITPYLEYSSTHGMRITHLFETHAQADHLSGSRKLSEVTGAPVHYHEAATPAFPVTKVKEGDEINVGNVRVRILHTPGHTEDSMTLLVSDLERSPEPWLAFTGDTLFVGDTGRPDLDGDAGKLFDSLWGKIMKLPDSVEIYPSHFAGSSCGKAMSPKPNSTIGFERKFNLSLRQTIRDSFVSMVMDDLPVQPPRFHKVRAFNLGFLAEPPIERTYDMRDLEISVEELKKRIDQGDPVVLVDVREPFEFRKANIGGKLIPLNELPNRMGELDKQAEIVIHCHHGGRSHRAVQFLYENGFENVKNLAGGIEAWAVRIDPKIPRY